MNNLTIIVLIIVVAVLFQIYSSDVYKALNIENFDGALQSLYSNDGIQDTHLTINSESGYNYGGYGMGSDWGGKGHGYDGYRYWRGIPWNLPTRNLNRTTFYPYRYDYHLDRYGRNYPYW